MKTSPLPLSLVLLCHVGLIATLFSAQEADEPFAARIECRFRCDGATGSKVERFKRTFSPVQRGLRRGNGNYWGVLGRNLWDWGSEWCLEKAVNECSQKNRLSEKSVAEFSLVGLSSATWEVNEPIDCRKREANALSPYGLGMILEHHNDLPYEAAPRRTKLSAEPLPRAGATKCKQEILATICYGDCLVPSNGKEFGNGDPGVETLASSEPSATDHVRYCADSFVETFSGRGLAPDVLKHYCEGYVWNGVMKADRLTNSCAATRISTDCDKLAKGMK